MTSGVDVSDIENRNGALNVVDHLKDLFEAPPQFLPAGGLDAYFGGRAVLNPREDRELIFFVVPNFVDAVDNAREAFATCSFAAWPRPNSP